MVRGRYGDALRFDGGSSCATIADATDLAPGEEFTAEAWVRPEGSRSHEPILVKEGGGFPDYSLGIGSSLAEASIGTAGGGHESVSGSLLEPDVWRHLAVTFDGASLRLFVDGELVGTKTIVSPDSSGPGALTIGCDRLLGTHFDGRVDELRIYDRVLGGTEVAADMETPLQTPKAGPVAAWSFDEGEGTTAEDLTGDGHTATIEGAEWVRGRYGDGLNFDSESDVLRVADSPEFDLTEEFTLEVWVRPEYEFETWAPILSKKGDDPSEQLWWLYMAGNKYNRPWAGVEQAPGFEQSVEAPEPIPSETWTHLALTWDGSVTSLYVDGRPVASAYTDPPRVGGGELEIGADTGLGDWFEGRIDEVRIYDRSLSAAEVGTDMGTPIRTPRSGPVAAWSFDEGEGTTAEDVTGDGHTATIEGAEWVKGKYGDALRFDGESDVVRVPHSPEFDLAEGFTLEAWVRPESAVNQWAPVVDKLGEGKKANEQPWWLYEADQKVNVPFAGIEPSAGRETSIEANESESLPVDAWSHLAVTWDGSLMSLYIDGRLVRTTPAGPLRVTAAGEVQIGADTELGDFLDGRIDEIRIYDRALETGEIDTDMEAPLETPRTGPVAAYSFDAGEGTVAEDVSGGEHEGTIEGAEWVRGHFGDALGFGGQTGCVTVPDAASLQPHEEFTLETWVRPEGSFSGEPLIYKEAESEAGATYALGIGLTAAGVPEGLAEGEEVRAPQTLERDVWTHLAFTYDGARMRLFIDGERVAERFAGPEAFEGEGPLRIGCDGSLGHHFDGRIDEVRVYERALNTGEIATDMATPLQTPLLGPVAGYSFDEGEGTTAIDQTGEGNDGTIEGASWVNGKFRDALGFDGVDDCVTVPNSASLQLAEEFTLQTWVRPEGSLSDAPVIFKETEGGSGHSYAMGIGFSAEGLPQGFTEDQSIVAPGAVERNIWTNIAYTYDGGRMRLFVDGRQVANEFVGSETMASTGPLHIGCEGSLGDHFDGRVDEARIYDRALSPAEVLAGLGALPYVQTTEAYGFEETEGVLAGTVNPQGADTTYYFEYGPTTSYGQTAPTNPELSEEVVTGDRAKEVEEAVFELQPESTYHFRVVAKNSRGKVVGRDQVLLTKKGAKTPAERAKERHELLTNTPSWKGFVGINWTGDPKKNGTAETFQLVEESGAPVFRVVIGEPNENLYDSGTTNKELYDRIFRSAAQHGVTILPDIVGVGNHGNLMPSFKPGTSGRSDWERKLTAIVERYGPGGVFWTEHPGLPELAPEYWEIWNEPNYGANGDLNEHVDAKRYGELLEISHRVLGVVKPGAKILFGGLLSVGKKKGEVDHETVGEFIKEARHYKDYAALSLHPYVFRGLGSKPNPTEHKDVVHVTESVEQNIRKARFALERLRKDVGESEKRKIWITELGWPVRQKGTGAEEDGSHFLVSQEVQRELLNQTFDMIKERSAAVPESWNIQNVWYYNLHDWVQGAPNPKNWASHCGLVEDVGRGENGNKRKAWTAFQNQAR
jgi:hypothetical protein